MPTRLLPLLLALAPATSGCATDGADDACEAIVLGVTVVPCAVAWGVGCVAGAGVRCCEGPTPTPDDLPSAAPATEAAPAASSEAADVAY